MPVNIDYRHYFYQEEIKSQCFLPLGLLKILVSYRFCGLVFSKKKVRKDWFIKNRS